MSKSTVAVLKTAPERVLRDVEQACDLAGLAQRLDPTVPTILKDNISWHYPFPGANTTPWQLEGVIRALRAHGFREISCVRNETLVTDPRKGAQLNHYDGILRHYGVPVLHNCEAREMRWVEYRPKAELRVLPRIFPEGIRVPEYFLGKNIVHLPTMKCHVYTTITGAMKNAFGGLLDRKRHYTHTWIHETLVDLLAIQQEIHPGIFALMDGTTAGDGPGPRTLRPVIESYLLASADSVAIDAVAARMMGFDPANIPFLRLANEARLGHTDPRQIEILGADISGVNWGFSVGDNLASRVGDLVWFGPLRGLQKLLLHTPLVHLFAAGSWLYHDYLRWPLRDRQIFEHWQATTAWGRLFASYGSIAEVEGAGVGVTAAK
jgi:uncharacterized protein (DUF362 family)